MESQLLDLQQTDDAKARICERKRRIWKLKLHFLENRAWGQVVEFKKANADLIEKLAVSEAQIAELRKAFRNGGGQWGIISN